MKKFCLVSFGNIYLLPYTKVYIDTIKSLGYECDLVFWDRDHANGENDKDFDCDVICCQYKLTNTSSNLEKVKGYYAARKFINAHLKQENYAGVVFLQSHAAVAFTPLLMKKYRNRFIVDIRDYSLENRRIYYELEKIAICNSYASVISSPAYKKFLPKGDYIVAHNYSQFAAISKYHRCITNREEAIKIAFIGKVRFLETDKKLLSLFKNDKRFIIAYYGIGSDVLRAYAEEKGIDNTEFYGSFPSADTLKYYEGVSAINNIYGNRSKFLDYALSNKLYHAVQLRIPILVSPETYMEEIVNEFNIGFAIDINNGNTPNLLYEWYHNINFEQFDENCKKFEKIVIAENEKFVSTIVDFAKKV